MNAHPKFPLLPNGYLHFARRRDRDLALVDDYLPWVREKAGTDADYFDNGLNCNSHVAWPWDKPESLHPINWVVSRGEKLTLTQAGARDALFVTRRGQ